MQDGTGSEDAMETEEGRGQLTKDNTLGIDAMVLHQRSIGCHTLVCSTGVG